MVVLIDTIMLILFFMLYGRTYRYNYVNFIIHVVWSYYLSIFYFEYSDHIHFVYFQLKLFISLTTEPEPYTRLICRPIRSKCCTRIIIIVSTHWLLPLNTSTSQHITTSKYLYILLHDSENSNVNQISYDLIIQGGPKKNNTENMCNNQINTCISSKCK